MKKYLAPFVAGFILWLITFVIGLFPFITWKSNYVLILLFSLTFLSCIISGCTIIYRCGQFKDALKKMAISRISFLFFFTIFDAVCKLGPYLLINVLNVGSEKVLGENGTGLVSGLMQILCLTMEFWFVIIILFLYFVKTRKDNRTGDGSLS